MYIRFNKFGYVDAVVPTAVSIQPVAAPGDVIWQISSDINPSKTIEVTENVQKVDPETGQPLFDDNGLPIWETETVENPDETTSEVIVTQRVSKTYTLMENPSIFTPDDIAAVVLSYTVVNSNA